MGVRIAICQLASSAGDVGANLGRISETILQTKADVYVLPELFLTGYGANYASLEDDVQRAADKLTLLCSENDIAVAVGMPTYRNGVIKNSLAFIEQSRTTVYDKIHLAKFGVYAEDMFSEGNRPKTAEFKGIRFGLSICYDIFFPELYRAYAKAGCDINLCVAASADPSRDYLERILPGRALENVSYLMYVNNIGKHDQMEFYGHSRLVGPLGNTLSEAERTENVTCVYVDKAVVANARKIRHHISDMRDDMCWSVQK